MSDVRWAIRKALRDKDLYDPRRRVRIDLDEIAHPADIARRREEFRDWGSGYDDLAGLGATFKPSTILTVGMYLGYASYCLCSGALLAGLRRVRLTAIDPERDMGPPAYGYRTLAMAAETFRRFLPEVRMTCFQHDVARNGLPPELTAERFRLVLVDEATSEGMLAVLRAGWGVTAPGGLLVASGTVDPERQNAIADFLTWLVEEDGASFSSQFVYNDLGLALFRRDVG